MGAPRLLLHACCGPCSIMPVARLREEGFAVTALFANPNIHPLGEYLRRREAMQACATALDLPVIWRDDVWDVAAWLGRIPWQQPDALTPEAASPDAARATPPDVARTTHAVRCEHCCAERMALTAQIARQEGFAAFSSTLLYSRYQPHQAIAQAGEAYGQEHGVRFVYRDFRSDWQQGIDSSKEMALYRQPYCGCVFSEAERYAKKLRNCAGSA